tara:strand:+ start:197 stop:358 length:162 start_codon:yes stop_codon:yes gene_type:complete
MKNDLINKRKFLLSLAVVFSLVSCGTTRGVFHGTGMVLEGMAVDAREIGNWIK